MIAFLLKNQGSMTWAVGTNDTRVGKGESLTINLGIKNDSLAKLERVTCKLKQNVEWHTARHSSTNKSIIRSSSFSKSDSMNAKSKNQLKLMKTSKKRRGGAKLGSTTQRPDKHLTAYEEILHSVQEGNNKLIFPIPDYVCQSYTGRLMKIRHYISIKAKTPSCYTDPKIHIPIEIVSPRDTPVVQAHAIPFPSAPPFLSSESDSYLYASAGDTASPYIATTFVVSGDTAANEEEDEEEIVVDAFAMDNIKQPSTTGADEQHSVNYEDTEILPAPFDSRLIEPLLEGDDSGRVDSI